MAERLNLRSSMGMFCIAAGLSLVAVVPVRSVHARGVQLYTHRGLTKMSDVIVIASATSTNAEEGREFDKEMCRLKDSVEPVITSFKIDGIMKGDVKSDRLDVVHYRFKPGAKELIDGPRLVRFETEGAVAGKGLLNGKVLRGPPPVYLLFLKVTDDGKYLPATGQMDPIDSVRRLTDADHDEQGEVK